MSIQLGGAPGFLGASGDGVDMKRAIRDAVHDVFSRRRLTRTATSGRLNKSCHEGRKTQHEWTCNTWDLILIFIFSFHIFSFFLFNDNSMMCLFTITR